jgi:predicted nucleic acid-binding protein
VILALIYVLDANFLLRLADKSSPLRPTVQNAVTALLASGAVLRTVPQTVFEFWAVATRPTDKNGLGLTVAEAENELLALLQSFPILPDDPALTTYWRRLVVKYGITGHHCHDARYIAALQAHGLSHFLTFDSDFNRYTAEGITIINPATVPAAAGN